MNNMTGTPTIELPKEESQAQEVAKGSSDVIVTPFGEEPKDPSTGSPVLSVSNQYDQTIASEERATDVSVVPLEDTFSTEVVVGYFPTEEAGLASSIVKEHMQNVPLDSDQA